MRVSVSIPDDLFESVEHARGWLNQSRSEAYANALREYLIRFEVEEDRRMRAFSEAAAREVFKRTEWCG
jgi:metal-responsive CopG/Arc/MetJ family transcriptional regulator